MTIREAIADGYAPSCTRAVKVGDSVDLWKPRGFNRDANAAFLEALEAFRNNRSVPLNHHVMVVLQCQEDIAAYQAAT